VEEEEESEEEGEGGGKLGGRLPGLGTKNGNGKGRVPTGMVGLA
jgi:hypothetical protein